MIYWVIVVALIFCFAVWLRWELYHTEAQLCDYKDALERMRNERDMLQREVEFMQGNQ